MIDLGSKIKKRKQYTSVGFKYYCIAQKGLVTKVVSFRWNASNIGLVLIKILQEALNHFNEKSRDVKVFLGISSLLQNKLIALSS